MKKINIITSTWFLLAFFIWQGFLGWPLLEFLMSKEVFFLSFTSMLLFVTYKKLLVEEH